MRKCNNCNRDFDDSVDFCPTCGARLGDGAQANAAFEQPSATPQFEQPQAQVPIPQPVPAPRPVNQEPVTVGEWMVLLVNLIPCVGPLVYFIIMLVWAFGDNTKPSKKTFGKANLIIYLVSIGIGVIFFLFAMIFSFSLSELFSDMSYYSYY